MIGWILNVSDNEESKRLIKYLDSIDPELLVTNGLGKVKYVRRNKSNTPMLYDEFYKIRNVRNIIDIFSYPVEEVPDHRGRNEYPESSYEQDTYEDNDDLSDLKKRIGGGRMPPPRSSKIRVSNLLDVDDDLQSMFTPELLDPQLDNNNEEEYQKEQMKNSRDRFADRKKLDQKMKHKKLFVDNEAVAEGEYESEMDEDWYNYAKEYIKK